MVLAVGSESDPSEVLNSLSGNIPAPQPDEAGAPYKRSHALVEESVFRVTNLNQDLTPRHEASLGYASREIPRL